MKKILSLTTAMMLIIACRNSSPDNLFSKESLCEIPGFCQVVNAEAVPFNVVASFQTHYPDFAVETWFNKDYLGYCALFTDNNGAKKLAHISNDGTFVSEEIVTNQQGEHQDSNSDTGCECYAGNEN